MIVIAILAILSAIVIFALNPTELFKKSRDSRRLADMQIISSAISFMESWNVDGLDLGTSTVIYLSLPDTSSTCSSYSLPTPPSGFSYNCVSNTNLRNADSTGWIPIDFTITEGNKYFAALPIDPTNNINYYYSYNPGGSFEVNAFLESTDNINKYAFNDGGDSMNAIEYGTDLFDMPNTFPHNWIKVPGNSLYGTSDFWVMQYEAKYSIDGHGASDATTDCKADASYDTYDWNKACTYTASNTINVVSNPLGSPIAGVTHTEAKAICVALGGHLITNQEWMTIVRNIDQQPTNWTSGTKGTGYLFNGNSADTARGYNGSDPDKGLNRNIRSSHRLSNSSVIYDLSGNVWEHVLVDINDTLLNTLPNDGGATGWRYVELTNLTTDGDFASMDELKPTDPTWDADQGMGKVYTNSAVQTNRVLLRGGYWNNTSTAGVLAAFLNLGAGSDLHIGFRCAR